MKKRRKKEGRRPAWPWVWLIQALAMLALGALTALSLWLGSGVHRLFAFGVMPLGGAVSACMAVRRGLNNYLAWLAPPLMQFLGNLLLWGAPPAVAPVFVCAFVSLVGAATGEVSRRMRK